MSIPAIAVDRTTHGKHARLALTYYFYPNTNCTQSTCQLEVGFVSSIDGGKTWSSPKTLAGPMKLADLADTLATLTFTFVVAIPSMSLPVLFGVIAQDLHLNLVQVGWTPSIHGA